MSAAAETAPRPRDSVKPQNTVRPSSRVRRVVQAASVAFALVLGEGLAERGASAAEYPSWDDVQRARSSESAKQGEITSIRSLIAGLETETDAARALAEQRGAEYEAAQIAFDAGVLRRELLARQSADAAAEAEASSRRAGVIAAQLARGGAGLGLPQVFVQQSEAPDALLYQLGALDRLTSSTSEIYDSAARSRNASQSLADQAQVAEQALSGLRQSAEAALASAGQAQQAAEAALAEQQGRRAELTAQLAVLEQNRAATEADYEAGVRERQRLAEEAARAEREAREAAQRARAAGGGGGAGGSGESPPIVTGPGGQGWNTPLPGARVSSEFGNRFHPIDKVWRLHAGIDLVSPGGTCGVNVYAAASGTVTFAGSNGGLGNAVTINHGGGRTTVYGHNSSLVVRSGWSVAEGQLIAKAGTTGASTGCHVHFETRLDGTAQNPRAVLAQFGAGF